MPRLLTVSTAAVLGVAAITFSASPARAEITIDPPGAACFVHAPYDSPSASDYPKFKPDQAATLAIHGAVKEAAGQHLVLSVSADPSSHALFLGSIFAQPDAAGNATLRYPNPKPESIFTRGNPLPTPKIEQATLHVSFSLNGVLRSEASVTFPIGILAAMTQARNERRTRHKEPWRASGLGPGTYYAFYRRRGRTVWRQRLGVAKGPCGYLSVRQYVTPPKRKGAGPWDIVIQKGTRYRPRVRQLVYRGSSRGPFRSTFGFKGYLQKP